MKVLKSHTHELCLLLGCHIISLTMKTRIVYPDSFKTLEIQPLGAVNMIYTNCQVHSKDFCLFWM